MNITKCELLAKALLISGVRGSKDEIFTVFFEFEPRVQEHGIIPVGKVSCSQSMMKQLNIEKINDYNGFVTELTTELERSTFKDIYTDYFLKYGSFLTDENESEE